MRWALKITVVGLSVALAPRLAAAKLVHIVAFGDSLTSGYLVPRDQAYPAQLQTALRKKGYDVVVKNAGLAGGTARHALRRFDAAINPGTDIAIVEFGINDRRAGASLVQVRERIAALLHPFRRRHIQTLVIGAGGLDFSAVAKANGALYSEWKLPPHKYRARDGAHFNAAGYAILVQRMLPKIETLIRVLVNKYS
jgi:acyl-CoA thioesterase-1